MTRLVDENNPVYLGFGKAIGKTVIHFVMK